MSNQTALGTRLTVCSACGHRGRLVIRTEAEVISRCHVCGDELRTSQPAATPDGRELAGTGSGRRGP